MKEKRVFLYVSGGDYSALDFDENYNAQEIYNKMKSDGITTTRLDSDDYIEVVIYEFGAIDDKFISFMKDRLCDYDQLKAADIFEVNP